MKTTTIASGGISAFHTYFATDPTFNRLRFAGIFANFFPDSLTETADTRKQRERLFQCAVKYYWEGGDFPLSKTYKRCIILAMSLGLPPHHVDTAVRRERKAIKKAQQPEFQFANTKPAGV